MDNEKKQTFIVSEQPGGINRDRMNAIYIAAEGMAFGRSMDSKATPPYVMITCTKEQWQTVLAKSQELVLEWHQRELKLATERIKTASQKLPGNLAAVVFETDA